MTSPRRLSLRRLLSCLGGALALTAATVVAGPLTAAPAVAAGSLPCDLYGSAGTSCVAAYSSTRALFSSYNGRLYQVQRASDGATMDVVTSGAGGYANAAAQTSFCANTSCTIPTIYDQTSNGNDLTVYPRYSDGQQGTNNSPADAMALPVTVAGHSVYGIYMPQRVSYRRAAAYTKGIATGSKPETIYEVASGTNVNNSCCSDFGNVEARQTDDNAGTMDTVNVSTLNGTFNGQKSYGYGPWVQDDLENGVYEGSADVNTNNHGNPSEFITALAKNNGVGTYALKGADSTNGEAASGLSTWYSGSVPATSPYPPSGQSYNPMRLEGSIVLGAGGDNSNAGTESFFEGVMLSGYSTDSADNQVQANIAAQGYDGLNSGGGPGGTITHGGKCIDVAGNDKGGNGAVVQLWDCLTRAADQHWEGSAYGLHTLGTMSRCLDLDGNGTANGTKLELYDCNGVGGQQWILRPDGSIFNPQSGRCLDDPSGNTANGTALQLYDCNGNQAQQFQVSGGIPLIPAVQNTTSDTNNSSQNCVDVDGVDLARAGQAVQTYSCQTIVTEEPESIDQKWTYNSSSQTLTSQGLCLDIDGNATADGSKLEVWTCNGVGGQVWQFRPDGGGYEYELYNPQSGRCLDLPSAKNDKETLQIYDCIGGDAQHYTMN